ncbi:23S rRNA (uracil-C(5))-methyltransferase RlmCD [bioreactor metagenome]|uniref:23S rRNA (Uracil-C(5))-methyltransferase RlmCD n=1 Tax=bioreactor metagenome TaxID=1076179 RepID=A0A645FDL0_9ZZZZ
MLNKNKVKSYDAKVQQGIRFMILRGFDHHFQCTLVTGDEPLNESVADELINIPDLVSLNQSINTTKDSYELFGSQVTCLRGSKGIDVQLGQYHYRLSPKAFFQLNVYQAEKIYLQVASHIKNAGLVVDAYCGIGSMTMFLKDQAKRVIGIENNKDAIRDAVVTARLNNAVNCEFIAGDAAEQLKRISQKHSIDVLVVNPPRSGMSDDMLESVMLTKAKQLLYVSCNPSTLAKNLAVLGKHYRIDKISPFDMFSYTPLVETVVSLYRK